MPPRDQERVLPVEADAGTRRALAVDVVVGVDEHAVLAPEPAPELVELLAQLGVAVGPGVAGQPPLPRPRLGRRPVVAERRRDHRPRSGQQRLRMAGDLRPAHREAHPREEAALAPVADVALGLLVRDGGRGSDRVQAELRTEPGQLSGGHDRIVPVKAIRIHEDGGPEVLRYEDVPDPVAGPGEVLVSLRAASLNHLDLWVRKGLPSVPKPRILGADGAGVRVDTGERVVINPGLEHGAVITVIGEHTDGTHCETIAVPEGNVFPLDDAIDFETAAAFPLVYETAYRMLVTKARAAGRRVGADLGDRRRRRDRGVRDRPCARSEDPRHLLVRGEARARARVGRRPRRAPRGGGRAPRRSSAASTSSSRRSARQRGRTRSARSSPAGE